MKVLIFGRTGSGKTTLAKALSPLIAAPILDGDAIRATYPNPLGFSYHDRLLHAQHMSALADAIAASGNHVIMSTIAPNEQIRRALNADHLIYCSDPGDGKYVGSNPFDEPTCNVHLYAPKKAHPAEHFAMIAADEIAPAFNPMRSTALFVGRFQPFHSGHKRLIEEGIKRYGQACIGVRDQNRDWPFEFVRQKIDAGMAEHRGRYNVIPLPNIKAILYGRDVGYDVEQVTLPADIEAISGTTLRHLAYHGQMQRDLGIDHPLITRT